MKQTENLGLNLPDSTDSFNVNHYNENFIMLDEKIKQIMDALYGGGSERVDVQNLTFGIRTEAEKYIFYSSESTIGGRYAYHAFDNIGIENGVGLSGGWRIQSGLDTAGQYIGYIFDQPIQLDSFRVLITNLSYFEDENIVFKIQGSNDGSAWSDLSDEVSVPYSYDEDAISFTTLDLTVDLIATNEMYSQYRMYFTDKSDNLSFEVHEIYINGHYFK